MMYFQLEPPARWQAGTTGEDHRPIYFDCADCGAREPEIAGFLGRSPDYHGIAVLRPEGEVIGRLALFCALAQFNARKE
jgi:hypothetical protein